MFRLVAASAGCFLMFDAAAAHAARLLSATVERDGKVVLRTSFEDNGHPNVGTVWSYLKRASFRAEGEVPADPADANRATLAGDVRVAVAHGQPLREAAVKELRLVRDPDDATRWRLADGEVERTAQAAGVELPRPPWWLPLLIIGAGVALVLAVVAIWTQRKRRGGTPAAPPE